MRPWSWKTGPCWWLTCLAGLGSEGGREGGRVREGEREGEREGG